MPTGATIQWVGLQIGALAAAVRLPNRTADDTGPLKTNASGGTGVAATATVLVVGHRVDALGTAGRQTAWAGALTVATNLTRGAGIAAGAAVRWIRCGLDAARDIPKFLALPGRRRCGRSSFGADRHHRRDRADGQTSKQAATRARGREGARHAFEPAFRPAQKRFSWTPHRSTCRAAYYRVSLRQQTSRRFARSGNRLARGGQREARITDTRPQHSEGSEHRRRCRMHRSSLSRSAYRRTSGSR
jgi:hypothetical protein